MRSLPTLNAWCAGDLQSPFTPSDEDTSKSLSLVHILSDAVLCMYGSSEQLNCGKVTLEQYWNPRLTSGLEYVMNITANPEKFGQRNAGFVWFEPEFSLCKTKEFRKLYEARAWHLAARIRKERGYDLGIKVSWNAHNELVIMTQRVNQS